MKFRKLFASLIAIAIIAMIILIGLSEKSSDLQTAGKPLLFSKTKMSAGAQENPRARKEWELMRLRDPATGEIPPNMRRRELAYARTLPTDAGLMKAQASTWTAMGPYNVGGRSRALAIDITNENVIFAGSVSGGLWRSVNSGTSWTKVTAPDRHHSVTCIAQDTRIGQKNVWYYGSGEAFGNSADYIGNGIYKSIDGGMTWDTLSSTVSGTPQSTETWDEIWNIALDPSDVLADVVYAATYGRIQRSDDGGNTWTAVLGGTGTLSWFTDVAVTSSGVVYATLSSFTKSFTNNATFQGIWRSDDGITWTKINTGIGWPSTYWRTVIGIDPSDENTIYFLAHICNSYVCSSCTNCGQETDVFFGEKEWNSLWKYTYLTGDGADSNGVWQDLSANIPDNISPFDNFNAQQSYNLMVAVKPGDTNTVFIGGTNLYRSTSGFTDTLNTTQIGGYKPGTSLPYYEIYPNQHPDQHKVVFLPSNPDVMISSTDGGVFKTLNCMDSSVTWASLNTGYLTTQPYTVAIDHGTNNSYVVISGMQDNGTWWTNSTDPFTSWTMPSGGDGSFCAIKDGGAYYYFSRQSGKMVKATVDNNGIATAFNRFDPITSDTINGGDYLFINPFILDPVDNNVMYLAEGVNLWRNDSLDQIPLSNEWDSISTGWSKLSNIVPITTSNTSISALACSKNPPHRLYYGIGGVGGNQRIFRMDSANTGNPTSVEITNNIKYGGYTSCIAIDPRDADKVLVVYSNYNVFSLYYTEDGGGYWKRVAGNLETGPPDGMPPELQNDWKRIGDGPSCRWASIIPNGNSTTYLVGTSVGLFATDTLIEDSMGYDSTVWVLQSAIGNVVVDMIDYRESDGFIALGTHGTGVYTNITDITGIKERFSSLKSSTALRIYPNPFSKYTNIDYIVESDLSTEASTSDKSSVDRSAKAENYVVCKVYDTHGKEIARLVDEIQPAGGYSIRWDVQDDILGNGIYFYKLEIGKTVMAGKMVRIH